MPLYSRESGQVAYEAYYAHSNGKSLISKQDLPGWKDLPLEIREAWNKAAEAVLDSQYDGT